MTKLQEAISAQVKDAMRAKDTIKLNTLRGLVSALQVAEKAEPGKQFTEDDVTKIVVKAAAQRRDAIKLYMEQDRIDLSEKEAAELRHIEALLPKQLDAEQLAAAVKKHVAENGYTGLGAMGTAMKSFAAEYAGQFDPKAVGPLVKATLTA